MSVVVHDPYMTDERAAEMQVERAEVGADGKLSPFVMIWGALDKKSPNALRHLRCEW